MEGNKGCEHGYMAGVGLQLGRLAMKRWRVELALMCCCLWTVMPLVTSTRVTDSQHPFRQHESSPSLSFGPLKIRMGYRNLGVHCIYD